MSATDKWIESAQVQEGDVPACFVEVARRNGMIAWDIETSGLSWRQDRIATCQVFTPGCGPHIVRIRHLRPFNLMALLEDDGITKVFHFARFDLSFIVHYWDARPRNIACTKIASKILDPSRDDHSLKTLLCSHLRVEINKRECLSDWFAESLTPEQVEYAAADVVYLPDLLTTLRRELETLNRWPLAEACFGFLPWRVRLDLIECGDVFHY